MELYLYNTLTKKKELFKPLDPKEVRMYSCGPTVYHFVHIGNHRAFVTADLLKRTLLFNNYNVKHVMNITDVGHLTSDADEGEDKMLKGAKRENKTVWQVAEFYTDAFKRDIKKLNLLKPDIFCRATDHITDQLNQIKQLEDKGLTYQAGGNVYFDTSKFKDYGKLVNINFDAKARVESDKNKKNPHDFVLWFTQSKFQDQDMKWKSPYGFGYPGWHIECSAMATKYLGEQFDIHTGGHDLAPVHHTNEIAQAQGATGKRPWVQFWVHNEFLVLAKGEKMSKSDDNFLIIKSLEEKGFNALDLRYFMLGTQYRKTLMFSLEALEGAKNARKKLNDKVLEYKGSKDKENKDLQKPHLDSFNKELNDDLNTPKALAVIWEMLKDEKLSNKDKHSLLIKFDEVLGLDLKNLKKEKIPKEILELAKQRLEARKQKDWGKSDELRDLIKEKGYDIGDTLDGYELKKV